MWAKGKAYPVSPHTEGILRLREAGGMMEFYLSGAKKGRVVEHHR